ncbi:hypothetical protein DC644_23205 [Salmonella enterica]|uniref:hypothetical protein n=1 Tax=Enterobacter hormaechei TaxID=158836 RepID=UPI00126F4F18|nr:hypothetical protein [Salmonella enterica]HDV8269954.1 hypothetical protein [Enterobacter hormaechei]EBF0259000.1 hypothetical protein [Salmonella enterica]EBF0735418.1 hypothetical protein [Salmonella enterica]EBI4359719.1 hypothetical protein [Salmonella enterica]
MKNENESKLVKYGKKTASGIGKITAITPTIELTKAVKDKAVDDTIEAYSFISRIIKPKGKYYSKEKKDFEYWYNTCNFTPESCAFVFKYSCILSYVYLLGFAVAFSFLFNVNTVIGFMATLMTMIICICCYIKFASRAYVVKNQDTLNPFKFLKSLDDIIPNYFYHTKLKKLLKNKYEKR